MKPLSVCYSDCRTLRDRDCLRPSSKTVDASQEVNTAIRRRQGSHKNVYMMKTSIRCGECTQRSGYVAMDFDPLALKARTSPILNITVDDRPHVSTGLKVLCGTNARVRNGVERVEDGSLGTLWDVRALNTRRDVTDKGYTIRNERDTFELK